MKPLITVVVPVYNVERYLEKCVQSILDQTWRELEIILVDDGSTDASGAVCDRFATLDSRVRVIHQPNSGTPAGARNTGVAAGTGQWFTFVDGDDYLDPDMVEYLYGLCEKTDSQIAACSSRMLGFPDANDQERADDDYAVYSGREAAELVLLGRKGFATLCRNTLYRTDIVRAIRFPAIKCYEDVEYIFLALFASERVCNSRAIKYNYVYRADSVSAADMLSKAADMDVVMDDLSPFISEHAPELQPALARRYVKILMINILDREARAGIRPEDRPAAQQLRQKVLQTRFDLRQLSVSGRGLYYALRLGLGPFTAASRMLYWMKRMRAKLKRRRA